MLLFANNRCNGDGMNSWGESFLIDIRKGDEESYTLLFRLPTGILFNIVRIITQRVLYYMEYGI